MTMTINEDFIKKTFYITPETANGINKLKKLTGNTLTMIVNSAIQNYEKLKESHTEEVSSPEEDNPMFLAKKVKFTDEYKRTTYYIKKENWSLIERIVEERNEKITIIVNEMLELYLQAVQYEGKK